VGYVSVKRTCAPQTVV